MKQKLQTPILYFNLFILLLFSINTNAQCTYTDPLEQTEHDALMALYNSTDGDNWNSSNVETWGSDCDYCTWPGVICWTSGYVEGIAVGNNNLQGTIPPELGNLSNLLVLGLGNNVLSGAIPSELGNLSTLETLYLSGNDLSGTIPAEIGNLSNLTNLDLSDNQFECIHKNLKYIESTAPIFGSTSYNISNNPLDLTWAEFIALPEPLPDEICVLTCSNAAMIQLGAPPEVCESEGTVITLVGTEVGVRYNLVRDGVFLEWIYGTGGLAPSQGTYAKSGEYTATLHSVNGVSCGSPAPLISSNVYTMTAFPEPVATITYNGTDVSDGEVLLCPPSEATLTGSGDIYNYWELQGSSGFIANETVIGTPGQIWKLTVTDNSEQCSDETTVSIGLKPNSDGDSFCDDEDTDDDNDGQSDADEAACGSDPLDVMSTSTDTDLDGSPNCVDNDDDNDGTPDVDDDFPLDDSEDTDTDGDGMGDNADTDDDNDGQSDLDEAACGSDPLDGMSTSTDTDMDGSPDCVDDDDDNDGTPDVDDDFPLDDSEDTDTDGDGMGDNADTDDDNDGQSDADEAACGSDPLDGMSTCPSSIYCSSYGESTDYEWIKRVKINGVFTNNTGSDAGYGDFTSLGPIELELNNQYNIQLKPGYANSSYNEYWCVWIDFNQDGDWEDEGELVFYKKKKNTVNGSINIPFNAMPGLTRMRVSMSYNGWQSPCDVFAEGEVEDYTVELQGVGCGPLPTDWVSQDIGWVNLSGYSCYDAGSEVFTVASSGKDIYGSSDKFHFVHTDLCGDGEVIAEVVSMTNTGSYALTGVMMRESLNKGSKNAAQLMRPNGQFLYQCRTSSWGNTYFGQNNGNGKKWAKVVRSGNHFTGYISNDGSNWVMTYSEEIAMPNCIKAGMAVSSYNYHQLNISELVNVEVNEINNFGSSAPVLADNNFLPSGQESIEDRLTKLSGFVAQKDNLKTRLDWAVQQAYFNSHFEVQRSTNGTDFQTIEKVQGELLSSDLTAYLTYDENPKDGINYYRIKQVGMEGDVSFTEVKEVNFDLSFDDFNLFPNPASNEVFFFNRLYVGNEVDLVVVNSLGIIVHQLQLDEMPNAPVRLDLNNLKDGVYMVRAKAAGFKQQKKRMVIAKAN